MSIRILTDETIVRIITMVMTDASKGADEAIMRELIGRYDADDAQDLVACLRDVWRRRDTRFAEYLIDRRDRFLIRLFACLTYGMFVQLTALHAPDVALQGVNGLWKKIAEEVESFRAIHAEPINGSFEIMLTSIPPGHR